MFLFFFIPITLYITIGYLKLFQLSGENFTNNDGKAYDFLLVDDAQDLTPGIHYYPD